MRDVVVWLGLTVGAVVAGVLIGVAAIPAFVGVLMIVEAMR